MKYFLIKSKVIIILISCLASAIFLNGCILQHNEENGFATSGLIEKTETTIAADTTEQQNNTKEEETIQLEDTEDELPENNEIANERALLENSLKAKLGKFFVPLPPLEARYNPQIKAKGIYVTANSAGLESRFNSFIDMVEKTELNAMVIDVKNDHGVLTYQSEVEILKEVMQDHIVPVRDIRDLMGRLEEKNIYPIARIVTFRDPHLPEFYPEWAIKKNDGTVYTDDKGFTWLNPYEKKVWDYNIAIAKEAALLGFKEIQFDYVRFPEDSENFDSQVAIANKNISKDNIIRDFIKYAAQQLKDYNVYVSVDVFGVIATYLTDKDEIGQAWEKLTAEADYIYPMVYPSHYNAGFFGFSVPDAVPGETILMALRDAIKRNATVAEPAVIRPWLQGFTATWIAGNINYGPEQIREQVEAAVTCGIEEFFIWNASNNYETSSFITEEEALQKQQQSSHYRTEIGLDFIGNTSSAALEIYLENISKKNWRQAYPYHASNFQMDLKTFSDWADSWSFESIEFNISNDINNKNPSSKEHYTVDIIIKKNEDVSISKTFQFEVFIENFIWKIKPPADFKTAISDL